METLYLVVGLGNPGKEYARTRHNAGFLLVETLGRQWNAAWNLERKFDSRLAKADRFGRRIVLAQPQTYMNLSGTAVRALCDYYRIPREKILIAVDDADLPFGEIRLRGSGSSGGHHGLESIEAHLGTREFARLRIGIGRSDSMRQISGHVLGEFGNDELDLLERVLARAAKQVECWTADGIAKAMSQFNGSINKEEKGH